MMADDEEEVSVVEEEAPPPERKSATPPVLHGANNTEEMPRRQHKYTTADLQPERPWKRYFLMCLGCLVMIAIMVLLAIFLQKLFDPDEDEDWDDDKVGNATDDDLQGGVLNGPSKLLPKNRDFLTDVCSEERLGTDRVACEQACAPAMDCCNPYASGNSTCFGEQVAACVTYSPCHALDGFNDSPANDLERICSIEEIELNPTACELACSGVRCCHTDIDSCVATATSFLACLEYAPCQNLRISTAGAANPNKYMAVAPPSLDEECRTGDPVCARDCRDGAGCSDPQTEFFRDNFVACLTYATCNQHEDATTTRISVDPIYSRVNEAPENLNQVCQDAYVNSTGPEECEEACSRSECCYAEGSASCFGDDPLGCMAYRKCSVLRRRRR